LLSIINPALIGTAFIFDDNTLSSDMLQAWIMIVKKIDIAE
jgi:hypothetical protein